MIEQVVNAVDAGKDNNAVSQGKDSEAINLISGKLVDVPTEFDQWSARQQRKWSTENNVDLIVVSVSGAPPGGAYGILKADVIPEGLKLGAVRNEAWNHVTGEELQAAITSSTPGSVSATGLIETQVVAGVSERAGIVHYELWGVPVTFAFQTRKGELGLLQVIRFTENPYGVRIRYKLVQPSASAAPPPRLDSKMPTAAHQAGTGKSEGRTTPPEAQLKVFAIIYGDAKSLMNTVQKLLPTNEVPGQAKLLASEEMLRPIRLSVTRAPTASLLWAIARALDIVEALLMRLDTSPGWEEAKRASEQIDSSTNPLHATPPAKKPEYPEFVGRTEAAQNVRISPRVAGQLSEVHVKDGQPVKQGNPLFNLDAKQYKSSVLEVEADLVRAEAEATFAEAELTRAKARRPTKVISDEEFDKATGRAVTAKAAVEAAHARLTAARMNLEATLILSPITGRAGQINFSAGEWVPAGGVLTTIVKDDPIYVYFDVDENSYRQLARQWRQEHGPKPIGELRIVVRIGLAGGQDFPHEGVINFVDNQADPAKGTIRFRAVLANPDHTLVPGMFARVRIPLKPVEKSQAKPEPPKPGVGKLEAKPAAIDPAAELNALQGPWKVVRFEKGNAATFLARGGTEPTTLDRVDLGLGRLGFFCFQRKLYQSFPLQHRSDVNHQDN